jgi:hypothetical protein
MEKEHDAIGVKKCLSLITDDELKYIYSDSNTSIRLIDNTPLMENMIFHAQRTGYFTYNLFKNFIEHNKAEELNADIMYSLGLYNSIGFQIIETQTEEQRQYMTELSQQYDENWQKIIDVFDFGNTANYIKRIYAKKFGMPSYATYIISCWNSRRGKLPEPLTFAVDILYMAEMMQYYDEKMADFYQIDKKILRKYGITDEKQFKTMITEMKTSLDND